MSQFICINGDILPDTAPVTGVYNRSFNFGDGLCEEMRTRGNRIIFWDDHWNNIQKAMSILKLNTCLLPHKNEFEAAVSRLIHRNKLLKSSKLRLVIFRKAGFSCTDILDSIEYAITAQPIESSIFTLSPKGVLVNINTDFAKNLSPISGIRTTSEVRNVLALIKAKDSGAGDSLFLNSKNNLVEATNSNLFIVKDNTLITPPLSDGCFDGVMRKKIIEIAVENRIKTVSHQSIGPASLYNASEILLANSTVGVQWVMGYRNRRYFNKTAKKLTELLNYKANLLS